MDFDLGDIGVEAKETGKDSNGGAPKKRAVRTKDQEEEERRYKMLMTLVAKLCLANALACRTLKAVVIQCFMVEANSPWAMAFKAGTTFFDTTIKDLKSKGVAQEVQKDRVGIPSIHGFNYLVRCLLEKAKAVMEGPKEGKEKEIKEATEVRESVMATVATWKKLGGWRHIHKFIPHARLHNM